MNYFRYLVTFGFVGLYSLTPSNNLLAEIPEKVADLAILVQQFVSAIPRRASEAYDQPTDGEIAEMSSVASLIMANDLDQAADIASRHGYEIIRFNDRSSSQRSIMLFEKRNPNGSWQRAWGLYFFAPDSPGHIIAEAPHPLFDINTDQAAVEVFRTGKAVALMIAGAHRQANSDGSADVARSPGSVFQAIHQRLLEPGIIVYQPHGFNQKNYPRYGEIVVSAGVPSPTDLQKKVVRDLLEIGFHPCLFDGIACKQLGARENVQGISTWKMGSDFIHTEINFDIRTDPERLRLLMNAIANTLDSWKPKNPEDHLEENLDLEINQVPD
ncbi:MAG: hypothetical protein HY547_06925 [Elusimicrobia bacterium]|nr:hypothetical protein [Elusimicrobiota bacterium]